MLDPRPNSFDPRRNSFRNLIDFVATGVDVPMEEGAAETEEATPMDVEASEQDNHHHHHHHHHHKKKDKKKKKEEQAGDDIIAADAAEKKDKKSRKKEKKKKKDKKKKPKEGDDGESDLELDSDDDLSLGSVPMDSTSSSEEEDEEQEANGAGLSRQVSNRASVADGLKGFQRHMNLHQKASSPQQPKANNSQRRHTLGAALKGFQIDVTSLQETTTDNNDSSSGLDNLSGLSKNLPTLSVAGVRQRNSRRQSSFDVFLKNTAANNKDETSK